MRALDGECASGSGTERRRSEGRSPVFPLGVGSLRWSGVPYASQKERGKV